VRFVCGKMGKSAVLSAMVAAESWTSQRTSIIESNFRDVYFLDVDKGWAVGSLVIDGGNLYHAWYTSDGGNAWTPQSLGFSIELASTEMRGVHFYDPNTGYAVGSTSAAMNYEGMIAKYDGANWTIKRQGNPNEQLQGVVATSDDEAWAVGVNPASTSPVVLKTDDGGETWTGVDLSDVAFFDANNGWAVGSGGIIISTADGGTTWTLQDSGTSNTLYGIYPVTDTNVWAVGEGGTILNYDGADWTADPQSGIITTDDLYDVTSVTASNIWAVGEGGTILNYDGADWIADADPWPGTDDLYDVTAVTASNIWAVGEGGTILNYDGADWIADPQSGIITEKDLAAVSAVDVNNVWAVGASGTIIYYDTGVWGDETYGTNDLFGVCALADNNVWTAGQLGAVLNRDIAAWSKTSYIPSDEGLYGVDFASTSVGYAAGTGGTIVQTTNGGATFSEDDSQTTEDLYGIDLYDATHMWTVGDNGTIRYDDATGTWTDQDVGTEDFRGVYTDYNTDSGQYEGIAVGTGGTIYFAEDAVLPDWGVPTSNPNRNDLYGAWFDYTSVGVWTAYAAGDSGSLLKSADGGDTWAFNRGPANTLYGVGFIDDEKGWACGSAGTIINTIDGGTTWTLQDSGTSSALYAVYPVTDTNVWAVGEGGIILNYNGAWSADPQSEVITTNDLHDVSAADADNVWAVGEADGGTGAYTIIYRDNLGTWNDESYGSSGDDLNGVSAVDLDANRVWAVGASGTILYRDTGVWGAESFGAEDLHGVDAVDTDNVWAVGNSGKILYRNAGVWGEQAYAGDEALYDVLMVRRAGVSGEIGWVVGEGTIGTQPTLLRTDDGGGTWTPSTTDALNSLRSLDIGWTGDINNVFAVGDWGRVETISPPLIRELDPVQEAAGSYIDVKGYNFGVVEEHIYFSDGIGGFIDGEDLTWTNTNVNVKVPDGAYTGALYLERDGEESNRKQFTMLPSITNVTDPIPGGGVVTINGEGFGDSPSDDDEVTFNGTYDIGWASVISWTNQQIQFDLPVDVEPGNVVPVTVTVGPNTSVARNVVVQPAITSIDYAGGEPGARTNTEVTLNGNNFGLDPGVGSRETDAHNVTINTSTVPKRVDDIDVTSWAYNQIKFTVPYNFDTPFRPRSGDVTVTSNTAVGLLGTGTLTILPSIDDPGGVDPVEGKVNDEVNIDGTCFGDDQDDLSGHVYFDGVDAESVEFLAYWNDEAITIRVPADAVTGDVWVTTTDITGTHESNKLPFTVKPFLGTLSKNMGRVGDEMTVTGTGFGPGQGAGTVTFNGVDATVTAWDSASITTTVPEDATSGDVVVTTAGGSTTGENFTVMPKITSMDPDTGVPGDTVITIDGYTFGDIQGNSEVQFAGVSAGTAQSWSRNKIEVGVPGNAASGEVVVSTADGISNGIYFSVGPKITSIKPDNGPPGIDVTIEGENFKVIQGAGKVEFNGLDAGAASSWSETEIKIDVPAGATTGDVVVTTTDGSSNGVPFTVGPANIMYFAEGTTRPGFDQWICIMNPNDEEAIVNITYMMSDGTTMPQLVVVEPTSRSTIKVIDAIGPDKDVSTKIASDQPIVAERPIYFNYHGLWPGGHDVVGAVAPAMEWYFAEGTTRDGFDEWLCLQNPNDTTVDVEITYMLQGEEVRIQTVEILPTSRETIDVRGFLGPNIDCSAKVTADAGIIAERPMYFNYQGAWSGGHDVLGATAPSTEWYFAEGTTRDGFDEWLCIQNPGLVPALVYINYMLGTGENLVQVEEVGAQSRRTISVAEFLGRGHDVSMTLTSNQPIVAERPIYFNYVGLTGGHDVVGATAPAVEWYFAEGATQNGFQEWLSIQNPNNEEAEVTITYMLGTGETQDQVITVNPRSRETVDVNSAVGWGKDVSARVISSKPIIVERPMYFNYGSKWPGGHDVVGFSW